MTSTPQQHDAVARLAATQVNGRRHVDATAERRFQALMRNDFLTLRGAPYKWQEITSTVTRTVAGGGAPTIVPVRYTWQRVHARTGTPDKTNDRREWTFARGQGFNSVLLHSDTSGVPAPGSTAEQSSSLDVSYPDLPKSPAVDLLLMLSWDVITFEIMCTHLATTAGLRDTGVPAELERISGTWANLRFSGPGTSALFRNTRATATKLGYGMSGGRPVAAYAYECLDCELTVRSGPIAQEGRSSYWGTVRVDAETGDLVAADMTEMIVALLTGGDGRQVPVQKRRLVRLHVGDEDRRPAAPEPAAVAEPAAGSGNGAGPALLADAQRQAGQVAQSLYWQLGSLDDLPGGLGPLATMGFRSMVGTDLPGAHQRVRALQDGLRAWAAGDRDAAAAVRDRLPSYRQTLEGLLAFGHVAIDEATRLKLRDAPSLQGLHDRLATNGQHITDLLALLDRLGDE